ncbi:hypothetical protein NFI96_029327, partial [Prochilodus magdalenae]
GSEIRSSSGLCVQEQRGDKYRFYIPPKLCQLSLPAWEPQSTPSALQHRLCQPQTAGSDGEGMQPSGKDLPALPTSASYPPLHPLHACTKPSSAPSPSLEQTYLYTKPTSNQNCLYTKPLSKTNPPLHQTHL